MGYKRYCDECGGLYDAERINSQYCGDKCRVAAYRRRNSQLDGENAVEVAKSYFWFYGNKYRVKVFHNTIWVELQPAGDNIPFERRSYYEVYQEGVWDINYLMELIGDYRFQMQESANS